MVTIVYTLKVTKLLFKNYCYLVVNENTQDAVLIDPAWEISKIEDQIEKCHANLKAILLTHHHIDHINLAEFFASRYNIPVYMSKNEIDFYGFSCFNLVPIEFCEVLKFNLLNVHPIFTPGHTKGAVCYKIDESLFTGDTLFIEGCGECFGQGGDPSEMFESLSYLKEIIPLNTRIYPGHSYGKNPGESFDYVLKNNIYLHIKKREEFIAFRMRKNQQGLLDFK